MYFGQSQVPQHLDSFFTTRLATSGALCLAVLANFPLAGGCSEFCYPLLWFNSRGLDFGTCQQNQVDPCVLPPTGQALLLCGGAPLPNVAGTPLAMGTLHECHLLRDLSYASVLLPESDSFGVTLLGTRFNLFEAV